MWPAWRPGTLWWTANSLVTVSQMHWRFSPLTNVCSALDGIFLTMRYVNLRLTLTRDVRITLAAARCRRWESTDYRQRTEARRRNVHVWGRESGRCTTGNRRRQGPRSDHPPRTNSARFIFTGAINRISVPPPRKLAWHFSLLVRRITQRNLRENYSADFHEIRWKGRRWATEATVRFWW